MHLAGPQIYQINRQNNSFQNMYGMLSATIDRLARKIDFVQKKTQNRLFWWTRILTLEGPGRQTVDTSSISGVPLKTLWYNPSNLAMWKVGGTKIEHTRFRYIFFR